MLPRITHDVEMKERERQLEAERVAVERAGGILDGIANGSGVVGSSGEKSTNGSGQSAIEQRVSWNERPTPLAAASGDDRTYASAPHRLEQHSPMGNRALNAVLTALSNYNDEDAQEEQQNGWGVDSAVEGTRSWDRPIVLHGADGILTKHHTPHHHSPEEGTEEFHSPYRVMEDLDAIDRMCIQPGSSGMPAYNWWGAIMDSKAELIGHFKECWREIWEDVESSRGEQFLLVCEFPMTVLRKVRCCSLADAK
jgi:hypothetical protein